MSVDMKADMVPGAEALGTKIVPVVEEESNHEMKVTDLEVTDNDKVVSALPPGVTEVPH